MHYFTASRRPPPAEAISTRRASANACVLIPCYNPAMQQYFLSISKLFHSIASVYRPISQTTVFHLLQAIRETHLLNANAMHWLTLARANAFEYQFEFCKTSHSLSFVLFLFCAIFDFCLCFSAVFFFVLFVMLCFCSTLPQPSQL